VFLGFRWLIFGRNAIAVPNGQAMIAQRFETGVVSFTVSARWNPMKKRDAIIRRFVFVCGYRGSLVSLLGAYRKRGDAAHSKRFAISLAQYCFAKRLECGAFRRYQLVLTGR